MGCVKSMTQGLLLVVNLIIFVCGVAVLGGGIYLETQMSKYLDFFDGQGVSTSIVFIVIGALIALVSFLGCCGACTSNACLMKTYGAILCILLIAEIGTAVAIYVFKGDVKDLLTKNMDKTLKDFGKPDFKAPTDSWNALQGEFKCCGVKDYMDWTDSEVLKKTESVPDSCCKTISEGCGNGKTKSGADVKDIYTNGCFSTFEETINSNVGIAAGIGAAIAVIQLVTIIAAFCVGKKNEEEFS